MDMAALGERTVILDCDVLQADGGTRTAAITGAFVALSPAVARLMQCGAVRKTPILDSVAAVSVGIVEGTPLLDLNYEEDSKAEVDMNVVLTGAGNLAEIQATAEHRPFDEQQMNSLLALARRGAARLLDIQKQALGQA